MSCDVRGLLSARMVPGEVRGGWVVSLDWNDARVCVRRWAGVWVRLDRSRLCGFLRRVSLVQIQCRMPARWRMQVQMVSTVNCTVPSRPPAPRIHRKNKSPHT